MDFFYCINPESDEPILLLNKHVGFDANEGQGIDGAIFQQELLTLDGMGKKRIQVWINSPGGIVMDGYNIYNAILKSKTKVDTYCVGIAASIAAVIFQAGRNRVMCDYGALMYHNASGGSSKELNVMNESLATMIANRSGKTVDEILSVMNQTSWINANTALCDGFCDEIEASNEQNKKRAVSNFGNLYQVANSIILEQFNHKKQKTMTKVTNKLGLVDSANEDAILESISAIENKAETAISELALAKNELVEANAKVAELEAAVAEAKAKEDEIVEAAKVTEIENSIKAFVAEGRIKAESVDSWKETANALGIDKVKDMISELPLNKVANKLPIEPSKNDVEFPTTAVTLMAQLKNKLRK